MPWRCSHCHEVHEKSFDACWRCGEARTHTPDERAELAELEASNAAAEDAETREVNAELARGLEAIAATADPGANWVTPEHRQAARAGERLSQFVRGYRRYRARHREGTSVPCPACDRTWLTSFLLGAVAIGVYCGVFLWPVSFWKYVSPEALSIVLVGSMAGAIWIGGYAATRELTCSHPAHKVPRSAPRAT